jgi:phosphate transport system substrate-binding protein
LRKAFFATAAAALALAGCDSGGGGTGAARNQIKIVGSSTVYPFTRAVAERFAQSNPSFKAPIVESTGTGAGMKLFCAGVGAQHPDVENASRRIKKSEFEDCQKNGVKNVIEVQVGIDGLALIESNEAQPMKLTLEHVYKALAATPYGKPNTAKTWKDVDPALPAVAIQVYGPPPTSGTRDALAEMILDKGCNANAEMKALKESDEDRHKEICTKVREDGVFI